MSISNPNIPKLVIALRHYSRQAFLHDLLAGITVGLVALPLAMAFGIASGVTPQAGLYTAVIAGFLISALGGSRTQIGGPTGAFVVIVAGIVARFGMSGLAMVTLMAGMLLLAMGLTGLGAAVRFIPRPVVIGFTNGIAVLIAATQIKDFFGLRIGAVPSEFLPRMKVLIVTSSDPQLACFDDWRVDAGDSASLAAHQQAHSGFNRRSAAMHADHSAVPSARGDHRQPVRWNSPWIAALFDSGFSRGAHSAR